MKKNQWMLRGVAMCLLLLGRAVAAAEVTAPIDPDNNVSGSGSGNYSGDITKITDGSGMQGNGADGPVGWPRGEALPATWIYVPAGYSAEWQCTGSGNGLLSGATNGKIGWLTFDIGASISLENLYFWNNNDGGGTPGINGFNLYFADSASGIPSPSKVDYVFSGANGWTQYGDDDADPTTPRYTIPQGIGDGSYRATINVSGTTARYIGIEVLTNHGSTARIGLAEFAATYTDTTPPTLAPANIVDAAGGSVEVYKPVTYTLTFVEQMGMDPSSVTTGDFSNASGGTMVVDGITQTGDNVFEVIVTPKSVGPLQLRVSSNITDWAGLTLAANVDDGNTITVTADSTAPQVLSISSYNDGAPVAINNPITYTVTFDQHMDAASFAIGDFVNVAVSAAPITVDSVSVGAVGSVYTVVVTPTGVGDVLLRVSSGSVTDGSGTATTQDWDDAASITAVDPGLVIYEPFGDNDNTLTGNTPGMGLTGVWSASTTYTNVANQTYGELITISNAVSVYNGWSQAKVDIDDTSDDYKALLSNGGQLWFSMIYSPVSGGRFQFGIQNCDFFNNGDLVNSPGNQSIGLGYTSTKRLYAGLHETYDWGPDNLGTAPHSAVDPGQYASVTSGSLVLIVGHAQWGVNDSTDYDTVTLYLPDTDLVLGAPVAVSTGVVDQSSFNKMRLLNGNLLTSIFDEIRVGATYNDVIPIPPPAGTVLIIK